MCIDLVAFAKFSEIYWFHFVNIDNLNDTESNINNIMKISGSQMGVFYDLNCRNSIELLNLFSNQDLFNYSYAWFLHGSEGLPVYKPILENINLNIAIEVQIIIKKDQIYNIYDVYKVHPKSNRLILSSKATCWKEVIYFLENSKNMRIGLIFKIFR